MAKLSLWLITLAKDRPFSFVDHAIRQGDSLLGITDLKQLRIAHLDPDWHRQSSLDLGFDEIEAAVDRALALRRDLEAFVVNDVVDAERKAQLLAEADAALGEARILGDLVVGAALAQIDNADPFVQPHVAGWVRTMVNPNAPAGERLVARSELASLAESWLAEQGDPLQSSTRDWADRVPFHWPLEFPEVWQNGGFDAIVGNPPFLGNKYWRGFLGPRFQRFAERLLETTPGKIDLSVVFHRRAFDQLRTPGAVGILGAVQSAEGQAVRVGLQVISERGRLIRAAKGLDWPGGAQVRLQHRLGGSRHIYRLLHAGRCAGLWHSTHTLSGQ